MIHDKISDSVLAPWQTTYADLVHQAQTEGTLVEPVTKRYMNCSVRQAYEIQYYNIAKSMQAGIPVVGYKIGLTTNKAQVAFSVDSPIFAPLLSPMVWEDKCRRLADQLSMPVLEVEIAFYVAQDIRTSITECADILPHIASGHIAFELVTGRLNSPATCAADLIADNCASKGIVIGDGTSDPAVLASLSNQKVELFCHNTLLQEANTRNILGSPFLSIMWLSNMLLEQGAYLRKGEVVMTGSATAGVAVMAGERYTATCPTLGSVQIDFL